MESRGEGGDIEFAPRTHERLTLQLLGQPVGRNSGGVRIDTPRLQVAQHEVRPVEGHMVRVRLRSLHRLAPRDDPTVLGPGKERAGLQEGLHAFRRGRRASQPDSGGICFRRARDVQHHKDLRPAR